MNKNYIIVVLFFVLFPFLSVLSQNTTWYVSQDGTGNGTSWALSSNSVQNTINNAQPGDQVWVKQGTYQNVVGVSFSLKEGIAVYGGFPLTANPVFSDRNPQVNETILKGNQSRVLEAYGTWIPMSAATILDGFTIREGYASAGAGMHLNSCNATFRNLKVTQNTSNVGLGAGISMSYSDATLIQVLVVDNTSILITGYEGDTGGIRINGGTPKFYNCVIADNHAEGATGGISVTNTNCYFYNCIVYGNTSDYVSPDIYMNANFKSGTNGVAHSSNSILQDCGGSEYLYNIPQFMLYGIDMGGNYDVNPMFNADYSIQNPIGINKGNTQAYLAATNTTSRDYFNNDRIVDAIDIGLSEYQTIQSEILYVKENGTGTGSSWADASGDLQQMMDNQFKGKSVWVAEGTYYANSPYFRLRDSIKVYGGFPAIGNPTFADRDAELHPTIMTSAYDAIIGNFHPADKKLSAQTLVDGITITKNPNSLASMYGLLESNSDAVYQNCTFTDLSFGVAEIRDNSQSSFIDCTFSNNSAINDDVVTINVLVGGEATFLRCNFTNNYAFQSSAIQVISNSKVWVDECVFANNANHPHTGNGKVFNVVDSEAIITNSIFESNGTSAMGGNIMWILGPILPNNPTDTYPLNVTIDRCIFRNNLNSAILFQGKIGDQISISNSLFYKNTGSVGAGFSKLLFGDSYITNCTFTENHANNQWGGALIYGSDGTGTNIIRNSILYDNTSVYTESGNIWLFQPVSFKNTLVANSGGSTNWNANAFNYFDSPPMSTDLGGNIDANPLFANITTEDYHLQETSPAINTGSNTVFNAGAIPDLSALLQDIEGNERIKDSIVDMGAYEFEPFLGTLPFEAAQGITVYPNPTEGPVQVLSEKGAVKELILYSILGKQLLAVHDKKIDIGMLSHGIYILKVRLDNNKSYAAKLIKK